MALTKAQLSLVSVATLGVAAGGYTADLAAFGSQKEAAAFIATTGLLNVGSNAEFVNTVNSNLNNGATALQKAAFLKALDEGASRSDAAVDFANTVLVEKGSIANVTKAIASTSTSKDIDTLKLEITPAVNAQDVKFVTQTNGVFNQQDLKANLGKAEIENGAGKISADFTFELKNQANVFTDNKGSITTGGTPGSTVGEFTGAFLSPMLERAAAVQSDSAIYVKLLDGFALRDNFQSIERLATNGVGFSIDGVTVVVADKPEDGDQGAIYKAKNYTELKDALTARLAELAAGNGLPAGADAATYAKLATFTVEPGSIFTKANQAGDQVTGTELVIKDASGSTLVPQGFSTYGGIHPHTDLNSINELTNQAPSTSTQLISTNIVAENVGYGSQGATLNIAGQSASKKGVEEFKVTATKDVWFTRLESRDTESNQHLQDVLLQTGSNGYFRVGTQDKGASLVALVDQDFGVKGGGLVDVLKLDASAANSTAVNAFISDKVIARNYNLKDTDNNYKTEDVQVSYNLTGGNDVLQLAVASEVLAYADTQVNIVAGGGNDTVHLKVVDNELTTTGTGTAAVSKVENAGAGTGTYGKGWLANQQLNDNVKIDAASGDNTIWTEGSGNVRITTGNGNDTIYADNSGRTGLTNGGAIDKLASLGMGKDVNALYVFNAENTNIGDILSNTANGTDGKTNTAQVFNTFKNTVSVTFKGIESAKHIEIASTDYTTSTLQINQAIKKAILEDATLNKLLTVKEFPGNVLVVESLIDGKQALTDLTVNFVTPAAAGTLPAALLPGQIALGTNDLAEAGKKYAKAGATPVDAVPATMNAFVTTDFNAIYTTKKAFATDGADTGTAEVQTIVQADIAAIATAVATPAFEGTMLLTVAGQEVVVNAGDTADTIGAALATALDAKTVDDLGLTGEGDGTETVTAVYTTGGDLVLTFAVAAGDISSLLATSTPSAVVAGLPTMVTTTLPGVVSTTGEIQKIDYTTITGLTTAGTINVAGVNIAIETGDTATQIATKVAAALNGKDALADLGVVLGTAGGEADGAVAASASAGVVTIVYPISAGNVGDIDIGTLTTGLTAVVPPATAVQTTQGVEGAAAAVVEGANSDAHSDNIINAGAGNDVIVLGTGTDSNDTVVLSGTFGKTTIVNFDDTSGATNAFDTTPGNKGDLLDFRTYLDANYGATTSANVSVDATATMAVAANQIKVVNFTDLQGGTTTPTETGGITTLEKLGSVTAAQLKVELDKDFDAITAEASKNVFLIHNSVENAGEYLVVSTTSTKGTAATDKDFSVTIVGTLDFGAVQNFAGNIVGFDGHIA